MPKLDIEFELTGLKLKIKGESEDVTGKVANLQQQVQNLMGTIASLTQGAAGQALPTAPMPPRTLEATTATEAGTSNRRRNNPRKLAAPGQKAEALDFKHDAEKYGFPKQDWSTAQKAMWLLYVLTDSAVISELSSQAIAATFNKHFKSFKTILVFNITRDLNKEKGKTGAVNSDATKNPETWHLLETGKKQIAALIAEAKGSSTA